MEDSIPLKNKRLSQLYRMNFSSQGRLLFFLIVCIAIYCTCITYLKKNFLMMPVAMNNLFKVDSQIRDHEQTLCEGYGKFSTRIYNNTCKKRLPNCIIIGVTKGGTMALLEFLTQHPQVVRNKKIFEYSFFSDNYYKGLDWYRERMPYSLPGQIIIEKSPNYFPNINATGRVFRMNPDIQLLLAVRDPVHRAISEYAMHKESFETNQAFRRKQNTAININESFPSFELIWEKYIWFHYDTSISNWLKFFRLDQIHIVDGDKFSKYPVPELRQIESFLNIDHYFSENMFVFNSTKGFYCLNKTDYFKLNPPGVMKCQWKGKGRQHPNVSSQMIEKLRSIFRPHNQRFFNLTGRYFDWEA